MSDNFEPIKIIVYNKEEEKLSRSWDKIEQGAKIFSLVALPLVIAIIGFTIQNKLSEETIKKEYVALSIEILSNENIKEKGLKKWAVELLNTSSSIKLSKETADKLINGEIYLSSAWDYKIEALRYQRGQGVKKDYKKAVVLHKEAARKGDTYAMYNLAWIFMEGGYGVTKDLSESYKWLLISKEQLPLENYYAQKEDNIESIKQWLKEVEKKLNKSQLEEVRSLALKWQKEHLN